MKPTINSQLAGGLADEMIAGYAAPEARATLARRATSHRARISVRRPAGARLRLITVNVGLPEVTLHRVGPGGGGVTRYDAQRPGSLELLVAHGRRYLDAQMALLERERLVVELLQRLRAPDGYTIAGASLGRRDGDRSRTLLDAIVAAPTGGHRDHERFLLLVRDGMVRWEGTAQWRPPDPAEPVQSALEGLIAGPG